ncbi:MAG TPA: hypothetical protein VK119_05090 [Bacillota bacterium]|nr:hypothetical protein [Bacillota bacterium]
MKWFKFIVMIIIMLCIYVYEKAHLQNKKEQFVLVLIITVSGMYASVYIWFPNFPNITEWIEIIFKQ